MEEGVEGCRGTAAGENDASGCAAGREQLSGKEVRRRRGEGRRGTERRRGAAVEATTCSSQREVNYRFVSAHEPAP